MKISGIEVDFKNDLHYMIVKILNLTNRWGLTDSDIRVFSVFLDKNEELRSILKDHNSRMTLLFSPDTIKELVTKSKMSYASFNNSKCKLRKKGFLKKREVLESTKGGNPFGISFNKDTYELSIKFTDILNEQTE